ncbi:hypothetical protein D7X96_02050 [Corallococcus interemptor]|uniref:Uncharacterized protein n=1 Tax=Corallococcus interemptor TaxID=2316720 RepID=A0A3A8QXP2_9BACT|nr:hypothetical protein D7X96_02050 [Corallococcus interemptor]
MRLCLLVGIRQEGQGCLRTPFDVTAACIDGLECRGRDGYCARACTPGQHESCPEGFFCADVKPAPACLPTCEKQGCLQGERCIPFKEGTSICASIYGPNCLDTPCPEGRECEVRSNPEFPGKVWAECLHRCSPTNPACEEGQVCDHYHCLQACDPNGPNPCAEGFHCDRRGEELPWSCQPDTWRGG